MGRGQGIDSLDVRRHAARHRDQLVGHLTRKRSSAIDERWRIDDRRRIDDNNLTLLLAFGLRRDANCLDVGENQGLFLRQFRRIAPNGHHIAYEPLPNLAAKLAREYPEIDVRQRALSNEDGECTFVHVLDAANEGFSGLSEGWVHRDEPTETITVTTERLDDHLPDGWLPDFVKIDVEGAERLVFEGAIRTFRLANPTIAFEHGWHGDEDRDRSEPIYKLICEDLGLRLFDMDGNGPLELSQFLDGLRTRWNWVAHE